MAAELPEYYFRVRENGAAVFRVDTENRHRRIEMDQIAVVNIRNGAIKPHGEYVLTDADLAHIQSWMEDRNQVLAHRDIRRHSPRRRLHEPHHAMGAIQGYRRTARRGH